MLIEFFQSIDLQTLRMPALFISMVGLTFAMFTEQLQLIAKYHGAVKNAVAVGYNNAMKIMVANRLAGVSYFIFMAFAVDLGTQASLIALFAGTSTVILAILSGSVFIRLIDGKTTLISDWKIVGRKGGRVVVLSFVATVFNILGLAVPMILSALIPEFRLTLANTGFLFNIVFTVVNVFIIENHIAHLIDIEATHLKEFTRLIFLSRFAAALLTGSVLILLHSQL